MRKLEPAPVWHKDELYNEAIRLRRQTDLTDIIQKINHDYLYWDKVKHKKNAHDIKPEVLWTLVKLSRVINAKQLQFGKYNFSFIVTDKIQRGLHEFDLNIGGYLGSQGLIPEEDKKRYLVSSIMEEAIASSQIEGAVTTRKAAKEMLRKNAKPKNKSEQMILNNYETIRHIVMTKDSALTKEALFEIHRCITKQTLEHADDEGIYRGNNEIKVVDAVDGEIVHIPPDFNEITQLMDELFSFFNNNSTDNFIHPIIKGCVIHFMIGYIHPFVDGNGRTARALFYWYLLKNGYWLTEYLSISRLIVQSKTQYALAYLYTETDANDLTYFIDYKIKTMRQAFEELRLYIQRKFKEKKQITFFQKIDGINERQAFILKLLNDEPDLLLSVKEIENRFNISNQTARTDLQDLLEKGFLQQINLNKKSRGFYKSDQFEALLKQ